MDIELDELIIQLNRVGLKTIACCTGHNKLDAYIALDLKAISEFSADKSMFVLRWKIPFKVNPAKEDESTNLWKIDKKQIFKETDDAIFVEIQKPKEKKK